MPDVRGDVGLSARLWHIAAARAADHAGRMRRAYRLDSGGISAKPHLQNHHDGLSYQPVHNGAAGADRAAVLSSQLADRKRPCIKEAPLDRQLLSGAYLIKKCVLVSPPRIVYPMVVATRSEH